MANEVKTMGSRLGVIVKTIDGWDIRYDHWSAQTLGRDIALDGYEATLTRIRQMAPYGVDTPQEMKSAPWLEGTLFIDMTTKRIVWAEESEGCYLPRLINALIELTWPGWTAIWSPEGTRGTLRATGHGTSGIDEPVGQIPQHGAVVAVRILVDQIAAVDDHVSGEAQAVRMPSRVLGQRDEQQAPRRDAAGRRSAGTGCGRPDGCRRPASTRPNR